MKKKELWFPLMATVACTAGLYTIGNVCNISLLSWGYENTAPAEAVIFEAHVSIIPILAGLLAGFVTERMVKAKQK